MQISDKASRRSFLVGAGQAGAVIALGATAFPVAGLTAAYAQEAEEGLTDADLAAFLESVELAAVEAYRLAAGGGKLPASALPTLNAYMAHHQEHARALAAVAGDKATGKANPTVLQALTDQLSAATDQNAVLSVVFDVENAAASTYLFAVSQFDEPANLQLAASILPVESQHAVVVGQLLGRPLERLFPPHPDPTKASAPNAFETKDRALDPSAHPVTKAEGE